MIKNYEDFYIKNTYTDERQKTFFGFMEEKIGFVPVESYYREYTVEDGIRQAELYVWIDSTKTSEGLQTIQKQLIETSYGGWSVNDILGETTSNLIFELYFRSFGISPVFEPEHLFLHVYGYKERLLDAMYGRATTEAADEIVKKYPKIPAKCILYGYRESILILAIDGEMVDYLEKRRDKLEKICRRALIKQDYWGILDSEPVTLKIVNRLELDKDTLSIVLMTGRGVNESL